MLVVAVVEPLLTLPQALIIFKNHDASDISLLTWIGFNCFAIIWIIYAIKHKEKIVLIYQSMFFILDTMVIIGALIYGGKWF